jgi:hypothetical protein
VLNTNIYWFHILSLISIFVAKCDVRYSLTFVVLILGHKLSSYIGLLWGTKFYVALWYQQKPWKLVFYEQKLFHCIIFPKNNIRLLEENQWLVASQWQSLSNKVVWTTPNRRLESSNFYIILCHMIYFSCMLVNVLRFWWSCSVLCLFTYMIVGVISYSLLCNLRASGKIIVQVANWDFYEQKLFHCIIFPKNNIRLLEENQWLVASQWQSLSNKVVWTTPNRRLESTLDVIEFNSIYFRCDRL